MINSRDIADLVPRVQVKARAFIAACKAVGIDVILTSTYRDEASQDDIFAQGRTKPGHIVTDARGGDSFHNYRLAFDFAPLVNGKPNWDNLALFARCGAIAESVGLEWAGRWTKFKEMAHCQEPGQSLVALKAGRQPVLA